MPIYEYQCEDCGHQLEVLQKIADAPLTNCPKCGNDSLRKKVSAAAFRLKGGGWYETDFKSKNQKNIASSDSQTTDSGKKPASAGKETKKDTKSEKKAP